MKQQKILVVGSANTDMVIQTDHLPVLGETILGGTFFMNPGGKGANQAVAIARLGERLLSYARLVGMFLVINHINYLRMKGLILRIFSRIPSIPPV